MARDHYSETGEIEVKEVGFVTNSKYENLGVSPDGLVGEVGAVEFKCPSSKNHIDVILKNTVPKDYVPQLLLYFIVMEKLEWIDFVSFDPRVTAKPMHTIGVTRSEYSMLLEEYIDLYNAFSAKMEQNIENIIF